MLVEIQDVRKTYQGGSGAVLAVDGVSLSLEAGEFVAVQGPSGCGKSTLLLLAGGLLAPESGSVQVAGEDPYALAPDARSRFRAENIGFVFQQFHLVPYLSVLDNVLAPSIATGSTGQESRAKELIERFGLTHRIQHVPGELSSGERQRAALARALLNQPKVLLADEPTGILDTENATEVLKHLREFASSGGAVLLVTHDAQAAAAADRVIHIRDGKLDTTAVS
ncbi:MAG: ABC transporter ATP-binding protein [Rhodopirellula sp.]|nr:ABC transporter ATP-binding protein [Rhodopirellula sp.]